MDHQLQTILKGLKMPGMAACWQTMEETHQADKLSLRDGLQILIQAEKDSRESNRISKLVKDANFRLPALLEELDIDETRGVPADVVLQLSSGEYIKSGQTVIICGATGTGKSFLACALGNKACRQGYKVAYYTMQKLMDAIRIARIEGKDQKLMERLSKLDILIIDDFGMKPIEGQQQNDFEQILDDRYKRKALIISSQLPVSDWHALFKNELIADACMDRMVHKPVRFQLTGESLRKKY
jgi:DNA replication protein DnaC